MCESTPFMISARLLHCEDTPKMAEWEICDTYPSGYNVVLWEEDLCAAFHGISNVLDEQRRQLPVRLHSCAE